jgi:hypothetical protein
VRPLSRRATLRYQPDVAFYIFFPTNISTEYFKHAAHSPFFSSKCLLFHNATFFGSCIIHNLHTKQSSSQENKCPSWSQNKALPSSPSLLRPVHSLPQSERSSTFSFNSQDPLVSLESFGSCLCLFSSSSRPFYLPSSNVFYNALRVQNETNPVSIPLFCGSQIVITLFNVAIYHWALF